MANLEKIRQESKKLKSEVREKVVGYIGAGLGVIVSLAWNEAIKALIEHLFPLQKDTITAKFIYAGIMTLVLVFVTIYVAKLFSRDEKNKA